MIGKLESTESALPDGRESAPFALSDWSILALEGPDALTFAQSQLMNDVTRLVDGQWQWNGWLNPKGRMIALCIALRQDAQTLWLLLPDMPAGELATALQRYVFRSKLKLAEVTDRRVAGCFLESTAPTHCFAHVDNDGSIALHFGRVGDEGTCQRRILLLSEIAAASPPHQDVVSRWRSCDLEAGLPHLDAGQREQHTPQMLSLDRLHAFSVKKGCYPGQEIVSRTHYLGKAKRRLCRLRLTSAVDCRVGDSITDSEGRPLSTLFNVARSATGIDALAILDDEAVAFVDGRSAERLPLLDHLPY